MSEYQIGFAKKMSDTSLLLVKNGLNNKDSERVVLYIALVASEIALKSALETAGMPIKMIIKNNHNLSKLLNELGKCTIEHKISPQKTLRIPATDIRSIVIDKSYCDATVGNLLQEKKYGASKFPNEIRYGKMLRHFPPPMMAKLSKNIVKWVQLHEKDIKYKNA